MLKLVTETSCEGLVYNQDGLIPAVIQDSLNGEVLMLAYINHESLAKTLETGETWFYSRSRQELWNKGATSGNRQKVKAIYYDCDADTLLLKVDQQGVACHKGFRSCFSSMLAEEEEKDPDNRAVHIDFPLILEEIIESRRVAGGEKSYVASLFAQGLDSMLKKIGEEGAEVVIAAKNNSKAELVYEAADLLFHLLVVLRAQGVRYEDVMAELFSRHSD